MSLQELKAKVYEANLALVEAGLVKLSWGNASAVDRAKGILAIKPSGVPYAKLKPDDMVLVSLESGQVTEGTARPSSDTATHWHLYRQFPDCGAVVHTHSLYGTSFAQAGKAIPCLGTTHADNFYGSIPVTRELTPDEIQTDYELNTGKVIAEYFKSNKIDPAQVPGVLIAGHAPFAWGPDTKKAVENAIVLEFAAQMAMNTFLINPSAKPIAQVLIDKHFLRKHGANAYYGQPGKAEK